MNFVNYFGFFEMTACKFDNKYELQLKYNEVIRPYLAILTELNICLKSFRP